MRREIILNSKIFFPNPYVIRMIHQESDDSLGFSRVLMKARKLYNGVTWAYSSKPEYESKSSGEVTSTSPWASSYVVELVSYWAFVDHQDALQFLLSIGDRAKQVTIWPSTVKFTIYLYHPD